MQQIPIVEYSNTHPEYPSELHVENEWIVPVFYDKKYIYGLPDDLTDKILALPHDSLRRDVEQIILWETGRTCDGIPEEEEETGALMHCLFFLAEVGDERSLAVVLETMRQNEEYYDFYFGDSMRDVYPATLYRLGKDRLDTLYAYMEEPGLYTWTRTWVITALTILTALHPERREETFQWFRRLLHMYTEKVDECKCCDGVLAGMTVADLMDLHPVELLPEIKQLFATGKVDKMICGDYDKVEKEMLSDKPLLYDYTKEPVEIHALYKQFRMKWGREKQ